MRMQKRIRNLALCMVLTAMSSVPASAEAKSALTAEEELAQLLNVDESQYHLETRGNVQLIVPGHVLLDGNYENGELVNGSVYYSVEDALEGVKRDKEEANMICQDAAKEWRIK